MKPGQRTIVRGLAHCLEKRERLIVMLTWADGLTAFEISELLGIPIEHVAVIRRQVERLALAGLWLWARC